MWIRSFRFIIFEVFKIFCFRFFHWFCRSWWGFFLTVSQTEKKMLADLSAHRTSSVRSYLGIEFNLFWLNSNLNRLKLYKIWIQIKIHSMFPASIWRLSVAQEKRQKRIDDRTKIKELKCPCLVEVSVVSISIWATGYFSFRHFSFV